MVDFGRRAGQPAFYPPYEPEPVAKLRERYPQAIETIHDIESVSLGVSPHKTPGEDRRCVFDFDCGVRLLAYRVRETDGGVLTICSGTFMPNTEHDCAFASAREKGLDDDAIRIAAMEVVIRHFYILAGPCNLRLVCISPNGVPSFAVVEGPIPDLETMLREMGVL